MYAVEGMFLSRFKSSAAGNGIVFGSVGVIGRFGCGFNEIDGLGNFEMGCDRKTSLETEKYS